MTPVRRKEACLPARNVMSASAAVLPPCVSASAALLNSSASDHGDVLSDFDDDYDVNFDGDLEISQAFLLQWEKVMVVEESASFAPVRESSLQAYHQSRTELTDK